MFIYNNHIIDPDDPISFNEYLDEVFTATILEGWYDTDGSIIVF